MSFAFRIEGLAEFEKGLGVGQRMIAEVFRDILRGPFGQEFLEQLRIRVGDSSRTGFTASRLKVKDQGADGVEVGIPESDKARHPGSPRANARAVGVWLESGTRMHMIPTKMSPHRKVSFGGGTYSRVSHPGTRATRPMYRTLQVFRGDGERLLERELDRRLGTKMGGT